MGNGWMWVAAKPRGPLVVMGVFPSADAASKAGHLPLIGYGGSCVCVRGRGCEAGSLGQADC